MTIVSTQLVDDGFKVINKVTGARNENEKLIELDNLKGSTNESEFRAQINSHHDDQLIQDLDKETCEQMDWKVIKDVVDMDITLYNGLAFHMNTLFRRNHEN